MTVLGFDCLCHPSPRADVLRGHSQWAAQVALGGLSNAPSHAPSPGGGASAQTATGTGAGAGSGSASASPTPGGTGAVGQAHGSGEIAFGLSYSVAARGGPQARPLARYHCYVAG